MRKIIIIILVLSFTKMFSQSDTTFFRIGSTKFIVFTDSSFITKKKEEKFKAHLAGVTTGINSLIVSEKDAYKTLIANNKPVLEKEALQLDQIRAWEFGFNIMEFNFGLYDNRFGVSTGLGFNINNYRFKNNYRIYNTDEKVVSSIDSTYEFIKSKMTVSYIKLPVVIEFQSKKNKKGNSVFYINAGMFVAYKMSSHMKYLYREHSEKVKNKSYENFHINPLQYGVNARIGIGFLEIYAEYNISEMFLNNEDLKVNQFSIGFVLINF